MRQVRQCVFINMQFPELFSIFPTRLQLFVHRNMISPDAKISEVNLIVQKSKTDMIYNIDTNVCEGVTETELIEHSRK